MDDKMKGHPDLEKKWTINVPTNYEKNTNGTNWKGENLTFCKVYITRKHTGENNVNFL